MEVWIQIDDKHPNMKRKIPEQTYTFQPEEELQLKLEKILPKLDVHAAPGPSRLRNGYLRIWAGVFAPEAAEEAVEHLELLIGDMANDKMPAWFMRATQDAKVITLVKREAEEQERTADHMPVQVRNTISKLEDKALLAQYQEVHIKEMMPQQLGVGVKFAAELLFMGLRMTLHKRPDFIIVGVDISNAFCEIMRANVIERHMRHDRLCGMVPYWRAKLGPVAKLWACKDTMEYQEELQQGSPTSSSGFFYTIHEKIKKADRRLVEYGGCARFGMDDGYMMGPMEVVFQVLEEFATGIKEDHECESNTRKCKMRIMEAKRCMEARRDGHIPQSM